MATSFDTMKAYHSIAEAGIEAGAATAITTAIADVATAARADLATKPDLENLRLQLIGDFNTKSGEQIMKAVLLTAVLILVAHVP